jgi:hypothetical protein
MSGQSSLHHTTSSITTSFVDPSGSSVPKAIGSLAKKQSDVTRQGTQKLKFVPTLPQRRKKECVNYHTVLSQLCSRFYNRDVKQVCALVFQCQLFLSYSVSRNLLQVHQLLRPSQVVEGGVAVEMPKVPLGEEEEAFPRLLKCQPVDLLLWVRVKLDAVQIDPCRCPPLHLSTPPILRV